ncbi:unnamed protein product [Closterium sp. NIES-53]
MDGENGCTPANPKCFKIAADYDVVTSKACDGADAASAHGAAVSAACGAEPAANSAQPRQPALSALSLAPVTPGEDEVSTKHRSRLTESDCSPEPTIEKNRNSPPEDDAEKGETCANAEAQAERLNSMPKTAEGRRSCGDGGETEERMRAQLADAQKMVRALVGELAARDVEGDDDVASGDDDEDVQEDDEDGRDQGDEFDLIKVGYHQGRRSVMHPPLFLSTPPSSSPPLLAHFPSTPAPSAHSRPPHAPIVEPPS